MGADGITVRFSREILARPGLYTWNVRICFLVSRRQTPPVASEHLDLALRKKSSPLI